MCGTDFPEGDLTESAATPTFEAFYRDALDPVHRAVLVATRHPERAEGSVQEASPKRSKGGIAYLPTRTRGHG